MNPTTFAIRIGKCAIVSFIAVMALLITFDNITDYYSNYWFVAHVMKMDTIFPESGIHYRSIQQPFLYHLFYIVLIVLQAFMTFFCLTGAWKMIRAIRLGSKEFHTAKRWAIYGLILGTGIWFLCFEVIGGEWFGMWQSKQWNGLNSAERIVTFIGLAFIILMFKEED